MDAKTCIQKLRLINSVSMATTDKQGNPQVRIMGVMRAEAEEKKLYFLTARGKDLYEELQQAQQIAVAGLSPFKEKIRIKGTPEFLPPSEQTDAPLF